MEKRPKRRKCKDNPYTLSFNQIKNTYMVSFKDDRKNNYEVEISNAIYEEFDKFELQDLSYLNEYDNHIEHSKIYEESLNRRAKNKQKSIEEIVEQILLTEQLKNAISQLPNIQKRRLVKYYFLGKTYEAIAKEEKCTKRAVKFSVDIAIKKIQKILKIDYTN